MSRPHLDQNPQSKPHCHCPGCPFIILTIAHPIFSLLHPSGTEILPLLVHVLERPFQKIDKDAKAKRLELAARATSGSGLYMTEAARFNTIATLTNLAALEANRMSMLHEAGLLDNICRAVHNERSDVPKQCSALAIMVSLTYHSYIGMQVSG